MLPNTLSVSPSPIQPLVAQEVPQQPAIQDQRRAQFGVYLCDVVAAVETVAMREAQDLQAWTYDDDNPVVRAQDLVDSPVVDVETTRMALLSNMQSSVVEECDSSEFESASLVSNMMFIADIMKKKRLHEVFGGGIRHEFE